MEFNLALTEEGVPIADSAAFMRTSSCPAVGCGRGRSSFVITFGGPNRRIRATFIWSSSRPEGGLGHCRRRFRAEREPEFVVSITRIVHAIEVSVVRDRISRSVS